MPDSNDNASKGDVKVLIRSHYQRASARWTDHIEQAGGISLPLCDVVAAVDGGGTRSKSSDMTLFAARTQTVTPATNLFGSVAYRRK